MRQENEIAFKHVLRAEIDKIAESRAKRRKLWEIEGENETKDGAINAIGIAFSGGGIRSATFNLGVLQTLAGMGLLKLIDYTSTVSGGGYIGSWLVAWIKREDLKRVEEKLGTDSERFGVGTKPREIEFLREYSNYLTPRLGAFSGDTWAFIGSYARNLILNQIVLGLFLVALLLLSRPFVLWFWMIVKSCQSSPSLWTMWRVPAIACGLLALALSATTANLSNMLQQDLSSPSQRLFASPWQINILVLFPIEIAVWLLWAWCWGSRLFLEQKSMGWTCAFTAGGFAVLWLLGCIGGASASRFVRWLKPFPSEQSGNSGETDSTSAPKRLRVVMMEQGRNALNVSSIISYAAIAGAVGGVLIRLLLSGLKEWIDPKSPPPEWHVASWGFPLAVLVFLFVQTVHIGLVGGGFTEDAREWWGRLLGLVARLTIGLSAFYVISIDGPWFVKWLGSPGHGYYKWTLGTIWALVTGSGIAAGKSPAKPSGNLKVSPVLLMKVAPPVFMVGLVVTLSYFTNTVLPHLLGGLGALPDSMLGWARWIGSWPSYSPSKSDWQYWFDFEHGFDGRVWIYVMGFALLSLLLSKQVGINRFSMNALYRNRLVRCYLGATRNPRYPQPFIGFDPDDDSLYLKNVEPSEGYTGPYPIVNTALNLVSSSNLAWQQRKAASFMFTPGYSGFEIDAPDGSKLSAFTSTKGYKAPLSLGTTMAISGAAASPNMGFHSSPSLSFLMTVFNVRLGRWIGNPRYLSTGTRTGPRWGLLYLLNELLGHTNDKSSYVYVSDGGHFENLGIYELVRRRCRFIIACDAGEDHGLKFGDLGNAIEKCRSDFGVDIEIDIERLRIQKDTSKSDWHCAIGTIHYERVDSSLTSGTLVYLKSSLTGDEPTDVQRYAAQYPAFPHQTTADQWFSESQFESYRALGQHIAQSTFGVVGNRKEISKMNAEEFFVKLRQHWYPPSHFVQLSFTKLSATYCNLLETLRTEDNLKFLDGQVYPQWPSLISADVGRPGTSMWLPQHDAERRAGFYFCNRVIQLMEDVYLDLNLEKEFDHPDNRGWVNFFRHWSWSGMFCATWAISASIYGARFQSFCERHLDLYPGKVRIGEPISLDPCKLADGNKDLRDILQKVHGFDRWEVELMKTFLTKGLVTRTVNSPDRSSELSSVELVPFRVLVRNLAGISEEELRFNIGFALGQFSTRGQPPSIWYFRIQNHVRKMGLAREALDCMLKGYSGLRNEVRVASPMASPEEYEDRASELEAIPSAEAVEKFRKLFDSVKFLQGPKIGG
jgi:hypothetical protein